MKVTALCSQMAAGTGTASHKHHSVECMSANEVRSQEQGLMCNAMIHASRANRDRADMSSSSAPPLATGSRKEKGRNESSILGVPRITRFDAHEAQIVTSEAFSGHQTRRYGESRIVKSASGVILDRRRANMIELFCKQ